MNLNDLKFMAITMLKGKKGRDWSYMPTDPNWWKVRAWVIANDRGRGVGPVKLEDRIRERVN